MNFIRKISVIFCFLFIVNFQSVFSKNFGKKTKSKVSVPQTISVTNEPSKSKNSEETISKISGIKVEGIDPKKVSKINLSEPKISEISEGSKSISLEPSENMKEPETTKISKKSRKKQVIDEIKVFVSSQSDSAIILKSDVEKPGLDGASRNLRDLVIEKLMLFDAKKLNIKTTDEDIDKMLANIKKRYNLSEQDFRSLQTDEFKAQLNKNTTLDRLLDFRVPSKRIPVSTQDVEEYLEKNPKKEESKLVLTNVVVETTDSLDELKDKLESEEFLKSLKWGDSFEIEEAKLDEDKKSWKDKNIDDIVLIDRADNGFEITKIVDKIEAHFVPLYFDEAKKDMNKQLFAEAEQLMRKERYEKDLEAYSKDLLKKASLEFTHESDKEEVLNPKKLKNS